MSRTYYYDYPKYRHVADKFIIISADMRLTWHMYGLQSVSTNRLSDDTVSADWPPQRDNIYPMSVYHPQDNIWIWTDNNNKQALSTQLYVHIIYHAVQCYYIWL